MLPEIKRYLPIAQAIEMLLYPYAEIVLHDLATNTIAAIFNSFSHREPGDDSLLEEIEFDCERGSRLVLKDISKCIPLGTPSDKSMNLSH
ncbi:hypothetical protein H1P_3240002 [Hyella patelloides LEGE 07179]|uniref:YheO-like domain-containing protein n=1 Tax=Hyella patelloides LEGE 07179 TaxID=945734 RepID=A0A563VV60_9CYAN|nr:PAS domain-containing protein [Hyella patelloides]VEP15300.1 hypothetical protein H1P_3240002 [Hyella patelloides LEGE 07179]